MRKTKLQKHENALCPAELWGDVVAAKNKWSPGINSGKFDVNYCNVAIGFYASLRWCGLTIAAGGNSM
ncbi:MAG: hypothetical protein F8N36_14690 [Desulfovibrio sp.]|uniref:hypothetical protein n=1 Tax=Desulfovibrio sp. TaxID=885 RepID=UPI00135E071C|nr:hypothetical protein [Desulfovibrio sp.]MTJ94086.1 hypothetical protein [Desulfovibrio sp.]